MHQGVKGHLHQSMSLQSRFLRSGSSFKFPLRRHLHDLKIQLFDLLLNSECLPGILSSPVWEFMLFKFFFIFVEAQIAAVNLLLWTNIVDACTRAADANCSPIRFYKVRKVSLFLFCIHPSKFYRRHEMVMGQTFRCTAVEEGSASACQSVEALWFRLVCGLDLSQKFGDLRLVTDKTQIADLTSMTWDGWLKRTFSLLGQK